MTLATTFLDMLKTNTAVQAGLVIVLVGLFGIGLRDLLRLSPRRVGAIASVCFRQSIRRRVLWITPLVILGVIVVSQFQKALDPQDAIRQTAVYCLFATGLLVTLVSLMIGSTNLPQEIESRVIYTVATKPITRLEIIIGKVAGFAAVSLWILVIMGVFTASYLYYLDWRVRGTITAQFEAGQVDSASRPTLEFYRDHGTLHAREAALPKELAVYARMPQAPGDFWMGGEAEGEMHARFQFDTSKIPPVGTPVTMPDMSQVPWPGDVALLLTLAASKATPAPVDEAQPATAPSTRPASAPTVAVALLNPIREVVVSAAELGGNVRWDFDPSARASVHQAMIPISGEQFQKWLQWRSPGRPNLYVSIMGQNADYYYSAANIAVVGPGFKFDMRGIEFTGRVGMFGQQVRGRRDGNGPVGVYYFRDVKLSGGRETYQFELRTGVEADSADSSLLEESFTHARVDFRNHRTKQIVPGIEVRPENNRPSYFAVPAAAVEGGDFDAIVRIVSPGWLGLRPPPNASLRMVVDNQIFAWNLAKSLSILWLMSVLVIIVSVFCSTFLSWPIAIVLSLVILTGRWGAVQLGDLAQPGLGRQVVTDMFGKSDAATARAVSESVDLLVAMLNKVSEVLPDISRYAALQDLQSGVAISWQTLAGAMWVTVLFGLPLVVLAYVFLRFKEVAP